MSSNRQNLCLSLLLMPSIFPSIRVFSKESVLHIRWPKYWSFSFSISPSNEYSGLISFRMDWLDLLAVQGTLKSLLQHRSSKPSFSLLLPNFLPNNLRRVKAIRNISSRDFAQSGLDHNTTQRLRKVNTLKLHWFQSSKDAGGAISISPSKNIHRTCNNSYNGAHHSR